MNRLEKIERIFFRGRRKDNHFINIAPKINKNFFSNNDLDEKYKEKEGVSIIIPAYDSEHFIERCLSSVENQTYFSDFNNYEILVGVDSCEKTLNKIKEIRYRYRNLSVYFSKKNVGPYVIRNTLSQISRTNNIIFFDSDDIMFNNMIEKIFLYKKDSHVMKFQFTDFSEKKIKIRPLYATGAFFCLKDVINETNGFLPWRCAADREFYERIKNYFKIKEHPENLFFRRIHDRSLTTNSETSMTSNLRKEYKKEIKKYYKIEDIKINPTYCDFIIV